MSLVIVINAKVYVIANSVTAVFSVGSRYKELYVLCVIIVLLDVATVVGYFVVSRPFLNLANPRHLRSSHSELLEVKGGAIIRCQL